MRAKCACRRELW